MLLVLSPAKSLDFESTTPKLTVTQPEFLDASAKLVKTLRKYSPDDLSKLMHISPKLGELNFQRNLNWQLPFNEDNARPAIFAFTGDVYIGLDVQSLNKRDLTFAQNHVRILSGLYGLLRPLDLMQPYRLEMGTALKHGKFESLYQFWGDTLTEHLNSLLAEQKNPFLLNLASNEYFKSLSPKKLCAPVVSPVFKDYKNGQYKIISFYAKKARGMMASWVIKNRVRSRSALLEFDVAGYRYSEKDSSEKSPVFLRKQA